MYVCVCVCVCQGFPSLPLNKDGFHNPLLALPHNSSLLSVPSERLAVPADPPIRTLDKLRTRHENPLELVCVLFVCVYVYMRVCVSPQKCSFTD